MSKHTPGKWSIDNVFVVSEEDELIAQIDPIHENDLSVYQRNPSEARANARLIAAAPELLAACETIANDCEEVLSGSDMSGMSDREIFGAMLETVRAAIAKAKGE